MNCKACEAVGSYLEPGPALEAQERLNNAYRTNMPESLQLAWDLYHALEHDEAAHVTLLVHFGWEV
jgi:hypothetical protein